MKRVYLVKTGQTPWQMEHRFDLPCGSPLSELGVEEITRIGKTLFPHEPAAIFSGPAESEIQTAKLLGKELKVRPKLTEALAELDFGLWQGMTLDELKHRQPKLHRQWLESPGGIKPPEGESLLEAQDRLSDAVAGILKKGRQESLVIVLRPVAFGLIRCKIQDGSLSNLWEYTPPELAWEEISMTPEMLR